MYPLSLSQFAYHDYPGVSNEADLTHALNHALAWSVPISSGLPVYRLSIISYSYSFEISQQSMYTVDILYKNTVRTVRNCSYIQCNLDKTQIHLSYPNKSG